MGDGFFLHHSIRARRQNRVLRRVSTTPWLQRDAVESTSGVASCQCWQHVAARHTSQEKKRHRNTSTCSALAGVRSRDDRPMPTSDTRRPGVLFGVATRRARVGAGVAMSGALLLQSGELAAARRLLSVPRRSRFVWAPWRRFESLLRGCGASFLLQIHLGLKLDVRQQRVLRNAQAHHESDGQIDTVFMAACRSASLTLLSESSCNKLASEKSPLNAVDKSNRGRAAVFVPSSETLGLVSDAKSAALEEGVSETQNRGNASVGCASRNKEQKAHAGCQSVLFGAWVVPAPRQQKCLKISFLTVTSNFSCS